MSSITSFSLITGLHRYCSVILKQNTAKWENVRQVWKIHNYHYLNSEQNTASLNQMFSVSTHAAHSECGLIIVYAALLTENNTNVFINRVIWLSDYPISFHFSFRICFTGIFTLLLLSSLTHLLLRNGIDIGDNMQLSYEHYGKTAKTNTELEEPL